MNTRHFNELMDRPVKLSQNPPEWQMFLEFCEMYIKKNKIKDPVAVELGTYFGAQKAFYEELLGVKHIGIDASEKRSRPDILGKTEDSSTLSQLKARLNGSGITILFIDASHRYQDVKKDFETYSPLVSDIIAFHDIEIGRNTGGKGKHEVFKFWDELKEISYSRLGFENTLFLDIRQCRPCEKKTTRQGIGLMVKSGSRADWRKN